MWFPANCIFVGMLWTSFPPLQVRPPPPLQHDVWSSAGHVGQIWCRARDAASSSPMLSCASSTAVQQSRGLNRHRYCAVSLWPTGADDASLLLQMLTVGMVSVLKNITNLFTIFGDITFYGKSYGMGAALLARRPSTAMRTPCTAISMLCHHKMWHELCWSRRSTAVSSRPYPTAVSNVCLPWGWLPV